MSIKSYHILNGDALKYQFPSSIKGKNHLRACLVDGEVDGSTNEALYHFCFRISLKNRFHSSYPSSKNRALAIAMTRFFESFKLNEFHFIDVIS